MKNRVVIRADAESEVDEIAAFLARENIDIGLRFYDAVDESLALLAGMPGIGKKRIARDESLKELRSWSVKGFRNYLIFYVPIDQGIEVIHVVHGAQDLPRLMDVD